MKSHVDVQHTHQLYQTNWCFGCLLWK